MNLTHRYTYNFKPFQSENINVFHLNIKIFKTKMNCRLLKILMKWQFIKIYFDLPVLSKCFNSVL